MPKLSSNVGLLTGSKLQMGPPQPPNMEATRSSLERVSNGLVFVYVGGVAHYFSTIQHHSSYPLVLPV